MLSATAFRVYSGEALSYEEHKLYVGKSYASFRVRACMDAHIIISPREEDDFW